jgi:hypothetical protein
VICFAVQSTVHSCQQGTVKNELFEICSWSDSLEAGPISPPCCCALGHDDQGPGLLQVSVKVPECNGLLLSTFGQDSRKGPCHSPPGVAGRTHHATFRTHRLRTLAV